MSAVSNEAGEDDTNPGAAIHLELELERRGSQPAVDSEVHICSAQAQRCTLAV